MKELLRTKAIGLRKQGYLYAQIARELGISKSTAQIWTSKTLLTTEELAKIESNLKLHQRSQYQRLTNGKKAKREKRTEQLHLHAKSTLDKTTLDPDTKRVMCALLFWCEGGKDVNGALHFINSDPVMIMTFLKLLRETFPIKEEKLRALIHLHQYHNPDEQLQYWSEITSIPTSQFYKPYLKPNTGKNIHPGYAGCVSLRYNDSSLGKSLKMIYSEFSQRI